VPVAAESAQLHGRQTLPCARLAVQQHENAGRQQLREDDVERRIILGEKVGEALNVGQDTRRLGAVCTRLCSSPP